MDTPKQPERIVETSTAGDAEITSTGGATEADSRARIDRPFPATPGLPFPRRGVWVTHAGRVGIVNAVEGDDAEVHYTDENTGETTDVARVAGRDLVQATLKQIPASRRPPAETAATFGYK